MTVATLQISGGFEVVFPWARRPKSLKTKAQPGGRQTYIGNLCDLDLLTITSFSNGKSTIHYFWNLCVFVFLLGGPSANLRLSSYQLTINPTVNLQ